MTFLHYYKRLPAKAWRQIDTKSASQPAGDSIEKLLPYINSPDELAGACMLVEHFAVACAYPIQQPSKSKDKRSYNGNLKEKTIK